MPLWTLEDSLHVGDIIKPHSYLGSVKVAFLFKGLDKVIKAKSFVFIGFMEKPVPFLVESVQWLDDTSALLKFADIDSDEKADELRNRELFVNGATIPAKLRKRMIPASTYEGFTIEDEEGKQLGIVEEVMDEGLQPLLQVSYEGGDYMIPVHEDIIIDVLLEEKILIVDLPEGLLSVNS